MPRKKRERYHYLYKTTNLINGKYYIGVHSTYILKDGYLGSGKRLKYAINKYGKENFKIEILEFFEDRDTLMQKEKEIVNEQILQDPLCMNLKIGGEGSFGYVTVKDEYGKFLSVSYNDPKFLSKELVGVNKHTVTVCDEFGKFIQVDKNDPRYLSGELKHLFSNKMYVRNNEGEIQLINKKDFDIEKYSGVNIGKITVKDEFGKFYHVDKNDPKYLSGELTSIWFGKKHSNETILKMKKSKNIGEKNSQYGSIWITNGKENKKIKNLPIPIGWKKGRI